MKLVPSLQTLVLVGLTAGLFAGTLSPVAAQSVVKPQPDGLIVCEAEEFTPQGAGWKAKSWGENYYSATFANTFLSRKAFLGAAEQADAARAQIKVQVPAAGNYLALVRYEAAYRFETQFTLIVEQNGKKLLERLYGANKNPKLWAFKQGLKPDVGWDWGASENIVWEGTDVFVALQPGEATLTLVAAKQPEPAAKRNLDLVMLTTDVEQVKMRIEKENYLPLDGMLTQSGDVWMKVTNAGDKPLTFKSGAAPAGGNWTEHSPYWVHLRTWKPVSVAVEPGKTSDWVEVGSLMDTLNDGAWSWVADGKYKVEFAVKSATGTHDVIASFEGAAGDLRLAADADTRRSKRLRRLENVLYDLLAELKQQPAFGKTPVRTPIYASTFEPLAGNAQHAAAVQEFKSLFALGPTDPAAGPTNGRGYIDVRSVPTDKLAEYCQKLGPAAKDILVVSLGDEIALGVPPRNDATNAAFQAFLQAKGLKPTDVDAAAGDWSKVAFNPDPTGKTAKPGIFYWSQRYLYQFGIQDTKKRTDILRQHLPNAGIGANYSPHYPTEHMFLGEVHKWVSIFREDGMTLPWSEDYIWQVPVGSPQCNQINLDLFRAGVRGKPDRPIHYYVMPHAPNNTPRMWRRLFYGALAHGMKQVNLFEFRPVQVAYTENHVSRPEMYATILRAFRELGTYEDFVQDGQVREAQVGLWFSETGDIWGDTHGAFGAAKRLLYLAIRGRQIPLDFVVEPDALDGTLSKYKVLYLTDRHVSRAASDKIAAWVRAGGKLVATAGAGLRDEYDQPNQTMLKLLGLADEKLDAPADRQIKFEKQDLPWVAPVATLDDQTPVFGAISRATVAPGAETLQKFADGAPAATLRRIDQGAAVTFGYLPSLTYYRGVLPKRPVDRGSTDDALVHFLPSDVPTDGPLVKTLFWPLDQGAVKLPITSRGTTKSNLETTLVDSKHGTLIPVIRWTEAPKEMVEVAVSVPVSTRAPSLASGGKLEVIQDLQRGVVFRFELDTADAIVLPK